ncbi:MULTISPECIES: ester cyclase [Phaeobacter]|uniref:SnoaL-like polyketide cyclase n=1 Tax=Phaeobacter piscinae TaxID=1580596 RepID=A0ABN5DHK7_9RHOB|nr:MULTISPECIES: ester cyclase [Phaeobacter]ATG36614.1 SnoaL-like polyketide cyclase [Phaeobacter piscinae]AUQ87135.1 SnoaL-like polyketide cyclase [Phaeobacter piscinae]AUR25018.1 SnoaL-like polyketide cyclase [Phaeobacter piscinae]KII16000.1 polyketide cyclase [Phaeobacter sp. S60]
MKGFDPKFKDFPDYIIGITKEIWEDRGIATLHDYYAPDIVVRSPASVVTGNEGVIAATMATLAEFPDRTLLGEDVIWSGTPEEGMLSSHRLLSTATHLGDGVYGKATGKKLTYRIIADCHAIDNQINDEWLIRDQSAIVQQMGWDAKDYARDLIAREGGPDACQQPYTPATDQPGPYKGRGNDNEWGQKYADILTRIMNADMRTIESEYDRAVQSEYPGGATGHSFGPVDRFWMGLRASFPTAKFTIEHQIGRDDPMMPPRAALRWTLHGKHDGWGAFGKPTGAEVFILGASHAEFGPWGLRREYTLFDETSVWKQILLQTGDL